MSDFSSRDENIYIAYGSFSQSTSALLRLANPEAYSGLSIKFDDLPDSLSESIYNEKCLPFPRSDGDASLTVWHSRKLPESSHEIVRSETEKR